MGPRSARRSGRAFTLRGAVVVEFESVELRDVHVVDGRIASEPGAGRLTIDLTGHVVYPGLVNAHDHLQLNSVPRMPLEAPVANSYQWIEHWSSHLDDPEIRRAREIPTAIRHWQGALKNLLCGTTTVSHHDPWQPVFDDTWFPVNVPRCGWCHSLRLGRPADKDPYPRYGPDVCECFRETGCDVPWIIHLAEGIDAEAEGELSRLKEMGCLAKHTVIVHGVGLSVADIEEVIAAGAAVVWCPASNLNILGRTLDPARLASSNRLALGTDSRISGASDLLAEVKVARATTGLNAQSLFSMITSTAAAILDVEGAGTLTIGARADMVILRDGGGDPFTQLLESERSEIRAVVRAGLPAVIDPDLAGWLSAAGIDSAEMELDGVAKLIDRRLLGPAGAAEIEPGLKLSWSGSPEQIQ